MPIHMYATYLFFVERMHSLLVPHAHLVVRPSGTHLLNKMHVRL
jgi:hypothetical protein